MYINTLYRMTPGILVFSVFTAILLFGWTQGVFLVFSPYIYEYRNYFEALNMMCLGIFGQRQEFNRFNEKQGNDTQFVGVAGLLINYGHIVIIVLFVSLVVHLFKKATSFERANEHSMITPDKERL